MKKILVQDWKAKKELTISDYVERELASDRDGALETANENANNAQAALARLCEILAEKSILTAEEITLIACGFTRDAKFIDA